MNVISNKDPIKVQVVDSHQIAVWGICQLLNQHGRYKICSTASSSQEALKLVIDSKPDVIILDPQLADNDGIELIAQISKKSKAKVIIFTGSHNSEFLDQCVAKGAQGLINKVEPIDTLLSAIEKIHLGGLWLNNSKSPKNIPKKERTNPPPELSTEQLKLKKLTPKEEKVSRAIQIHSEKTLKQISETLHISEHTMRNHLASIYDKLGVRNRMELYVFCGKFQKTSSSEEHPKRRSTDI